MTTRHSEENKLYYKWKIILFQIILDCDFTAPIQIPLMDGKRFNLF